MPSAWGVTQEWPGLITDPFGAVAVPRTGAGWFSFHAGDETEMEVGPQLGLPVARVTVVASLEAGDSSHFVG